MAGDGIAGSGNGPTIIIQNCTVHIHISGAGVTVSTEPAKRETPELRSVGGEPDKPESVDRVSLGAR